MVYRRFVGSGAIAQFLYGEGREEGRLSDTAFTLYVVDCGTWWQPVVQAQTYEEPGATMTAGIEMSARFSLGTSTDMAEAMLATLRVAGDPPKQIATEEIVRGTWVYGTGSAMQWVNSVTGAYAGMTSISYANWIELRADGGAAHGVDRVPTGALDENAEAEIRQD